MSRERLTLSKDGIWLSNGQEISHAETVAAFHRAIRHDGSGYFLEIAWERVPIEVEDTPYFVRSVEFDESTGTVRLTVSDGTEEVLQPRSLRFEHERLLCDVKNGCFRAKFLRAPFFELMRRLERDERGYHLQIGPTRIDL